MYRNLVFIVGGWLTVGLIAATIPDGYVIAFLVTGFGVITSLMAWTATTLWKTNEQLGRHDERITDLEQTVAQALAQSRWLR